MNVKLYCISVLTYNTSVIIHLFYFEIHNLYNNLSVTDIYLV